MKRMEEVLMNDTRQELSLPHNEPIERRPIVGVQILRFYMAFLVVSTHLGGKLLLKWAGIFYIFQPFHVPVFMLLSFFAVWKILFVFDKRAGEKAFATHPYPVYRLGDSILFSLFDIMAALFFHVS